MNITVVISLLTRSRLVEKDCIIDLNEVAVCGVWIADRQTPNSGGQLPPLLLPSTNLDRFAIYLRLPPSPFTVLLTISNGLTLFQTQSLNFLPRLIALSSEMSPTVTGTVTSTLAGTIPQSLSSSAPAPVSHDSQTSLILSTIGELSAHYLAIMVVVLTAHASC